MGARGWIVLGAVAAAVLASDDAHACSCMGPQLMYVGPAPGIDAPVNTRVRFQVPTGRYYGGGAAAPTGTVRVAGTTTDIATTQRTWNDGSVDYFELTATKGFLPSTRYEIAFVNSAPDAYPRTTVLSIFHTGTTADTTAPRLDSFGTAVAKGNANKGGGSCSIQGPWIEIGPIKAVDPGRPNATLMIAVWGPDAAGNVDTTKPFTTLRPLETGGISVGRGSLCDWHSFPIPSTAPAMALAIAAVDEAGNQSAAQRLPRIALAGVGAHP